MTIHFLGAFFRMPEMVGSMYLDKNQQLIDLIMEPTSLWTPSDFDCSFPRLI